MAIDNKNSKQDSYSDETVLEKNGDDYEKKLLQTIEEICPSKLKSMNHTSYINQLVTIIKRSLDYDSTRLFLLLDSVKCCPGPSYKRDTLVEVLGVLFESRDYSIMKNIFCKPFRNDAETRPWKELANAVATLPDLLANLGVTEKFPFFKKQEYYHFLIDQLFISIGYIAGNIPDELSNEHKMFLFQIVGRVAISGQSQMVWRKFTSKAVDDKQTFEVRHLVASILTLPIKSTSHQESTTFEIFIDHLYLPIFHNMTPGRQTGDRIKFLLGSCVLTNEHLNFIICDKSVLKTNYDIDRDRQGVLLHNIFSYLSSLVGYRQKKSSSSNTDDLHERDESSLLIKTLLEIVHNWSNGSRVLLRVYEHNRFITCALLVAFKYSLEYDRQNLVSHSSKIQSMIIDAIPTYLNRASSEQRNLSMCLSKLIMPRLHELIMEQSGNLIDEKGNKRDINLELDVDISDDLCQMQRLFEMDIDELYLDLQHKSSDTSNTCYDIASQRNDIHLGRHHRLGNELQNTQSSDSISKKSQNSGKICDEDEDDDIFDTIGDSRIGVPIYLHDCINGLIENNSARYVRLCLYKVNELLIQVLDLQRAKNEKTLCLTYCERRVKSNNLHSPKEPDVSETIRDVAIELAQVLFYLEDQYNIKNFAGQRLKCLTLLSVAAPDLVAKYLLEQFNESSRGLMRQLDILQVLVASARHLAGVSSVSTDYTSNSFIEGKFDCAYETSATTKTTMSKDSREVERLEKSGKMSRVGELAGSSTNRTSSKQIASFSGVSRLQVAPKINQFARHAPLYFYGIVHRLKADLNENGGAIIMQPNGIVPALRRLRDQQEPSSCSLVNVSTTNNIADDGDEQYELKLATSQAIKTNANRMVEMLSDSETTTASITTKATGTRDEDELQQQQRKQQQQQHQQSILAKRRHRIDDNFIDSSTSRGVATSDDDSYLHSRILFSISLIISCLNQQMITCRLAKDLLEILAAYRCHPDPGVQKALISCLKSIRDCTPSVYFAENIEERMLSLFSPWLSNQLETSTRTKTATKTTSATASTNMTMMTMMMMMMMMTTTTITS